MRYLLYQNSIIFVSNDASVAHVMFEKFTFIECLPVEVIPNRSSKDEEDGVEWIGIGEVKNANDPPTMVLRLVTCDRSPLVAFFFHHMLLVALDVSGPRVHSRAVGCGYPALTGE